MEEEKTVWDSLVDAFLEDMKQFPIDQSLYAFVTAYNIAMKEMEVEEDKNEIDYNKKMREVWEEIDSLRSRIRHLENRPQVQPPSKMYPNNPNWTPPVVDPNYWQPHLTPHYVPPWKVTCSYGVSGNTATLTGDISKCAFNGIKND